MLRKKREEIKEGTKINRLTIIKRVATKKSGVYYLCRCDCEKETVVYCASILDEKTKSCGCYKRDLLNNHNKSHNLGKTRQYAIWNGVMQRCFNPKRDVYRYYGGRGITCDPRWKKFVNFWEDMKDTYSDELTLDRINNDGNYCKENCHWVTMTVQMNNMTSNHYLEIDGVKKSLSDWARKKNMSINTIYSRIQKGWSDYDAVCTPPRAKRKSGVI